MNGNYPSQKIDWKKFDWSIKILQEIKLYLSEKNIWQLNYTCFRVFGALGQFGGNWVQIPQMGWDTQKVMLSLEFFIWCQMRSSRQFPSKICWSKFSKICWSNKKLKTIVSSTPSVSPSKPLSSYIACPPLG